MNSEERYEHARQTFSIEKFGYKQSPVIDEV